jgi:hypothetical protein
MWPASHFVTTRVPRRHPSPAKRGTFRPTVEALGERCLPSAGPLPGAGSALASLQSASADLHHHNFHLEGAGRVLGNPFADGGAPFEAAGHATSLGAWTNAGTLAVAPDGSAHGTVVFRAANGDLLAMTFTGQLAPDGNATGTFLIDPAASTGRFAGASGTLDMVLQQDLTTGDFNFSLDGDITYTASARSGHGAGAVPTSQFAASESTGPAPQLCRDGGGF